MIKRRKKTPTPSLNYRPPAELAESASLERNFWSWILFDLAWVGASNVVSTKPSLMALRYRTFGLHRSPQTHRAELYPRT